MTRSETERAAAVAAVLRTVEHDEAFAARVIVLPPGDYPGLEWEVRHSNLVSLGAVVAWLHSP